MTDAVDRLETAILADRDDAELYLVYADELQRAGDPRGELVVMQNQIQSTDDRQERHALQRTCDKWITTHDLLGPLKEFSSNSRGRYADITWRYGFIRCLEIGWGTEVNATPSAARAELEAILNHPSSPFITMLVLGPAPGSGNRMDLQCLVDAITATRRPRALRTLHVGRTTGWGWSTTQTGAIGEASVALQRLQKLVLEASRVRIGRLALPELRELLVHCGELEEDLLRELDEIECPRLTSITVKFDRAIASPDAMERRLRSRLPHVRKVRVRATLP